MYYKYPSFSWHQYLKHCLAVKPRSVLIPNPLLIAFNQFSSGHYDGIGYTTTTHVAKRIDGCRCGGCDKHQISRCCLSQVYHCRCPCLKVNKACTGHCRCRNCENPRGKNIRVVSSASPARKRQRHELQSVPSTSASFMQQRGEQVAHGKWSLIENLLHIEVVSFVQELQEPTVQIVHAV